MKRPGEVAICAEEGYDPLELIHGANRDLFGNDGFRGVQEDASVTRGGSIKQYNIVVSYRYCFDI